jgi:hypothetical protein
LALAGDESDEIVDGLEVIELAVLELDAELALE